MKLTKLMALPFVFFSMATLADFRGRVVSIADGDTITVLTTEKEQIKVRLANIDAPEKRQPYGSKAKSFTGQLVFNKTVYVDGSKTDQYGRVIGTVYLNDLNVNKTIVSNGYAWAYRRYLTDQNYLSLEKTARHNRLGLWVDSNPTPPHQWRKANQN